MILVPLLPLVTVVTATWKKQERMRLAPSPSSLRHGFASASQATTENVKTSGCLAAFGTRPVLAATGHQGTREPGKLAFLHLLVTKKKTAVR
jgi:hypothetical protein